MALLAGKDTGRRRLYVQRMSEAFAERTQQITFVTSEKCVREREREISGDRSAAGWRGKKGKNRRKEAFSHLGDC